MEKVLLFSVLATLPLAACGSDSASSPSLRQHLHNPLYARQYYTELTDQMVNIEINEPRLLSGATFKQALMRTKQQALADAQAAQQQIRSGLLGSFVSISEQVEGLVLLRENTLYMGPLFASDPGPSLRVYLTAAVDPRDVPFPDPTAIDLGPIASNYGAHEYRVPEGSDLSRHGTVVIWDTELQRLYGFAQMGK